MMPGIAGAYGEGEVDGGQVGEELESQIAALLAHLCSPREPSTQALLLGRLQGVLAGTASGMVGSPRLGYQHGWILDEDPRSS